MAEIETATHYEVNNLMGHRKAGTWNVLPAVLTAWSNLLQLGPNKNSYQLYKEQARNYVVAAKENAKLIESQRDIALRNLIYKNKLEQGNDVLRVANSGGNISGSSLDVVIRKEKIRKMNEQTLNANYTNQAMMEMINGYRQAASAYGTLAAKAGADKWAAMASILKGVETYVSLQVRDAKLESTIDAENRKIENYKDVTKKNQDYRYGTRQKIKEDLLSGDSDITNEGIILNRNSLNELTEINFV